jgi:chemotaxis-related protein WspB
MLLMKFEIGTSAYAVDSACIEEVVPWVMLRPVPHAPAYLAGMFHYRGKVIPVVDLGLLLGDAAASDRLSTRIMVVRTARHGSRLLGLLACRVSDLVRVDGAKLQRPTVHLSHAPYLGAVAETADGLVQILNAELILPESLAPALLASSEGPA